MISIARATAKDYQHIIDIGKVAVEESHRGSSGADVMDEYLEKNYNPEVIMAELNDPKNIYHLLCYDNKTAGFSKIIPDAAHPNIKATNVTKLDRIYLHKDFYDKKLGLQLLNHNITIAKDLEQSGIWLYSWIGNTRAVNFYLRAGFEIIGSYKFPVTATHFDTSHHMLLRFS